jgi:5-methylcytosine-specific restriction endonuclease McrA
MVVMFLCRMCQRQLLREAFATDRQKKDGRRRRCRECDAADRKRRWWEKREQERERERRYRETHREEIAARKQMYQAEKGRDKMLAAGKRYRQTKRGREVLWEKQKRWATTERGRLNGRVRAARRRALLMNAEGTVTEKEWLAILESQNHRCRYCQRLFNDELPATMDHVIPLTKGGRHSPENIAAACRPCNSRKWNRVGNPLALVTLA